MIELVLKSVIIVSNQIFISFKFMVIKETKEPGAVGRWAGGSSPRYHLSSSGVPPCEIRVTAPL
jgi:hypothetical protein